MAHEHVCPLSTVKSSSFEFIAWVGFCPRVTMALCVFHGSTCRQWEGWMTVPEHVLGRWASEGGQRLTVNSTS